MTKPTEMRGPRPRNRRVFDHSTAYLPRRHVSPGFINKTLSESCPSNIETPKQPDPLLHFLGDKA